MNGGNANLPGWIVAALIDFAVLMFALYLL